MAKNSEDGDKRSSGLPSSLIPLLYTPHTHDSSTRTTLPETEEEEDEQPRSASPFLRRPISPQYLQRHPPAYSVYNDPVSELRLPQTIPSIRSDPSYYPPRHGLSTYAFPNFDVPYTSYGPSGWREDEAGPSHSQRGLAYSESRERYQQSYRYPDQYQQQQHRGQSYSRQVEHYPDPGQYTQDMSHLSSVYGRRGSSSIQQQQNMYHFSPSPDRLMEPHNMARSWEPSNTGDSRNVEPPTSAYPSLLPISTRHESTEPDDDDGEYLPPGSRRGRKRKLPSLDERPQAKPKGKKTLIACDFCRGRKLRCDGKRPSCSNCKSRDDQLCVYQSHPRRRGPGKAPKGSRKKKSEVGTSASNDGSSQRYSTSGDDFDLPSVPQQQQTQGPTLLPYPSSRGPSRMNDLAFSQDSSQRYTGKTEDTEESVHPPHHHPHPDPF